MTCQFRSSDRVPLFDTGKMKRVLVFVALLVGVSGFIQLIVGVNGFIQSETKLTALHHSVVEEF